VKSQKRVVDFVRIRSVFDQISLSLISYKFLICDIHRQLLWWNIVVGNFSSNEQNLLTIAPLLTGCWWHNKHVSLLACVSLWTRMFDALIGGMDGGEGGGWTAEQCCSWCYSIHICTFKALLPPPSPRFEMQLLSALFQRKLESESMMHVCGGTRCYHHWTLDCVWESYWSCAGCSHLQLFVSWTEHTAFNTCELMMMVNQAMFFVSEACSVCSSVTIQVMLECLDCGLACMF